MTGYRQCGVSSTVDTAEKWVAAARKGHNRWKCFQQSLVPLQIDGRKARAEATAAVSNSKLFPQADQMV